DPVRGTSSPGSCQSKVVALRGRCRQPACLHLSRNETQRRSPPEGRLHAKVQRPTCWQLVGVFDLTLTKMMRERPSTRINYSRHLHRDRRRPKKTFTSC